MPPNYLPLISALISVVISAAVSSAIAFFTGKKNRRQYIDHSVDKAIDFSIAYPYLEDDSFCASYRTPDATDEEGQRYDNYCCFVFNTIESAWELCGGNEEKINDIVYADELVVRHRVWWESSAENVSGYKPGFRQFVDNILKKDFEMKRDDSGPA